MLQTPRRTLGRLSQGYVGWMGPLAKLACPSTETTHKPRDKDSTKLQARGEELWQWGIAIWKALAQLLWAAEASPSCTPVPPVRCLSPAQAQAGFPRCEAPPRWPPVLTGAASCQRALLSTAVHSNSQTAQAMGWETNVFIQQIAKDRKNEGVQRGAVSSPVLLSHLTPARAGVWCCSSPGAGGGITCAQAGCSLLTLLGSEGLRSLCGHCSESLRGFTGQRQESGALVQGAAWLPGACRLSAVLKTCWTGSCFLLLGRCKPCSQLSCHCCLHPTLCWACGGFLVPSSHPRQVCFFSWAIPGAGWYFSHWRN